MSAPTQPQLAAVLWLKNRGGDGVFDRNQVLVAAGQRAPHMRGTWSALEKAELVEFYLDRRRVRLTDFGRAVNLRGIAENAPCDDEDDEVDA